MNNEKIGLFISNLRKEKNMTQKDLGDVLGVTDRAVSKWERGICMPDVSLLSDISNTLDISIVELLNGEKTNKKISNEEILNTISYTKDNVKNKFMKVIDYVNGSIVIFICILLVVLNIRNDYYIGKTYYSNNIRSTNVYTDYNMTLVKDKIDIIKNNKGKYSKKEYESIMDYINELLNTVNFKLDKENVNKTNYTYSDISTIVNGSNDNYAHTIFINTLDREYLYKMLLEKDINKMNNYKEYILLSEAYTSAMNTLRTFVTKSYITFEKNNRIAEEFAGLYYTQYKSYEILLSDIIEVGEINE